MALKTFAEMQKIDISAYTEKRDKLDYLNWAKCIDLLHQNGAEVVYFTPIRDERTGSSLFMTDKTWTDSKGNTNSCYEVGVHIVIDDLEFDMFGPLMNAANPVKDNSLSQQRVWNCQTRLFVKGVAIRTGLGFSLWCRTEANEEQKTENDLSVHSLGAIKERLLEKITYLMKQGMTNEEIAALYNNMSVEEMRAVISYFSTLSKFEHALNEQIARIKKQ